MRVSFLALAWLAWLGSLAHAGVVTTTTTVDPTSSTTSTTIEPSTTTTTTVVSTTSTLVTTTSLPSTTSTTLGPATTTSTSTSTSTSAPGSSSTSTSSTSTSTSTPTSSTTSSTLPSGEVCGNCVDDDGDGLTDFEDPDCCAAAPGALSVDRLRLSPVSTETRLALDASGLPALASLTPPTDILFVQIAPDDAAPVLCASVHAAHFRAKRDRSTFTDRTGGVPSAQGISSIVLERLGTSALRLKLRAPRAAFATPAAERLRVTVALRSLVTPGTPVRCVTGTVDVVAANGGGLQLP